MNQYCHDKYAPLLIARNKDDKICKGQWHLGWLTEDDDCYFWSVWGLSPTVENALNIIFKEIEHLDERKILVCDELLTRNKVIQGEIPTCHIVDMNGDYKIYD